ncbi:N-acetyltransferase [Hyphomicrobium sp. CS1GBMeth3]|uniref:GNAT family N-acetyltransferase n=1 Tax=Hyphomicrobium sp. CS1GBMeth3 TaxID=1892845 RepID=UPI0009305E9E|nr:N-acetyltransferase [Hyphomicrobium sp. CS1GBMeth3]
MRIAPETLALRNAIRTTLLAAFPTSLEADLVDRLREAGDIEIGLVSIEEAAVIGYIAFSRLDAPIKALGLGPVAVVPERQRGGVGSALIRAGLEHAKAAGWQAVFVLGYPAYYHRFGFETDTATGFSSPYAGPYFMATSLSNESLRAKSGRVAYPPAFDGLEEQE